MQAPTAAAPGESLTQSNATQTPTPSKPNTPSLSALEDQLYDLLDSGGLDPAIGMEKLDLIQAFLHEHARERKSLAHFVSFFEKHGLPMQSEYPGSLTVPGLDLRSHLTEGPIPPSPPAEPAAPPASLYRADAVAPAARRNGLTFVWVIGFAALASMLALAVLGVLSMREELARIHTETTQSSLRLQALQRETEALRKIVLEQSEIAQRTERDAEHVLETLTKSASATESQ